MSCYLTGYQHFIIITRWKLSICLCFYGPFSGNKILNEFCFQWIYWSLYFMTCFVNRNTSDNAGEELTNSWVTLSLSEASQWYPRVTDDAK